MSIDKLAEFAKDGDKNLDNLDVSQGFLQSEKPERQWFNKLFNDITTKTNEVVDGVNTLELNDNLIQAQLDSVEAGRKAYPTYDDMVLNKDNIGANRTAEVTNDPDDGKNGVYLYDGTTFTRAKYDNQELAKKIVADAELAVNAAIDGVAIDANLVTDALITTTSGLTQRLINIGVASVRDLILSPTLFTGSRIYVKSFYAGKDEGGGYFEWSATTSKALANGGTIIDPSTVDGFDGTLAKINDYLAAQGTGVGSGCWIRSDTGFVRPEMFGAEALTDFDMAGVFNTMYKASGVEGFKCGSVKGKRYRIYTEVDIQGADATAGFTEFRLRSNEARVRIKAKSRARFIDIETNSGFTGDAIYLNGLDDWGTEYQNNMFDDFRLACPSVTGTAVYVDCTQPSSRVAYAHSTNIRIEGFENGLFLHAAATSGWAFINANSFINYMGGSTCKNFIKMIADKSAGGANDVDSNKLISFDFQNKNGDNALYMQGCKLNQLIGHTYFDLTAPNSVMVTEDSENNFIQGAWLQPFENISKKNTVINMNNSTTYKSYQKLRSLYSTEYLQQERFTLTPNIVDPIANDGSYFKTANTQGTTYTRFKNTLDGKVISIYVDDDFTAFTNSAYISIKSKGADLKAVKGCIYNFVVINGVAVLEADTFHTSKASTTIATGTQVFGPSNTTTLGRNTQWARIVCDDGVTRMTPVWDIPT